jgi:hypothetical protein
MLGLLGLLSRLRLGLMLGLLGLLEVKVRVNVRIVRVTRD